MSSIETNGKYRRGSGYKLLHLLLYGLHQAPEIVQLSAIPPEETDVLRVNVRLSRAVQYLRISRGRLYEVFDYLQQSGYIRQFSRTSATMVVDVLLPKPIKR